MIKKHLTTTFESEMTTRRRGGGEGKIRGERGAFNHPSDQRED